MGFFIKMGPEDRDLCYFVTCCLFEKDVWKALQESSLDLDLIKKEIFHTMIQLYTFRENPFPDFQILIDRPVDSLKDIFRKIEMHV